MAGRESSVTSWLASEMWARPRARPAAAPAHLDVAATALHHLVVLDLILEKGDMGVRRGVLRRKRGHWCGTQLQHAAPSAA